jgi:hypothetical protein
VFYGPNKKNGRRGKKIIKKRMEEEKTKQIINQS